MRTYELLISESIGYYVQVKAENEEQAIENYNEGLATEPYGEWTVERYALEVTRTIDNA